MKRSIVLLLAFLTMVSCKTEKAKNDISEHATDQPEISPVSDAIMENAVIYEANIRQYSPEGTFDKFTKDIPELKELGVKIIWLMPVFPISETKRKATGDMFASQMPEGERSKYLGSYYAVSDFKKINPEFGTIDDFRELVETAHDNGIYVILDWVPNHTGWDHYWLSEHPEFYTKNNLGEITDPLNEDGTPVGWADVADLNYDNEQLHETMISDMKYWITEEGIDGFRCDVAGSVPLKFWEKAIPELRVEKPLFMLAEAWEPELLKGDLFDMCYAWEGHHLMNAMAKGEKGIEDLKEYLRKTYKEQYEANDILMHFVTNHDENSWNGTIKERMGEASPLMTALSYMLPGMPLIYSGQEYNLDHRLKFFEKDSIPKVKKSSWRLLEKLGRLKMENVALNGGKHRATFRVAESANPNILKLIRQKNGTSVTFVANFSGEPQTVTGLLRGAYLDYMADKKVEFGENQEITIGKWDFEILIKENINP